MTDIREKIGYTFKNEALITQALTHPSYGGDYRVPHYQRLEFLGDAVLELYVSEALYRAYPDLPEGRLSRMRADLVREEALSRAFERLGLREYIRLSVGEDRSGGRDKPSIRCDIVEAIIGAIYLDGGSREAGAFIARALGDTLYADTGKDDHYDAKSRLQSVLQAAGEMPEYFTTGETGPAHDPLFTVEVRVGGDVIGTGTGRSKQLAQQAAAKDALENGLRRG